MDYFERLESETHKLYEIANEARSKGLDVELETEIPLAKDLAERVEGLVGPAGVAKRIKELEQEFDSREAVAFEIAAEIACQETTETGAKAEAERQAFADQGLRTALAILTEGVVAAPLEGISGVKIKDNADGSKYVAVYFAGPIRSAGGTAAALSVLLGDKIRVATGLGRYQPTDDEIERYVEEVDLYESEVTNLQYSPTADEVRFAARNIPVEVSGEPTDQIEVSHSNLPRVETNNIRGGALLAMVEGVIQKSKKILKIANNLGLESWGFLAEYAKGIGSEKEEPKEEAEETDVVQEEVDEIEEDVESGIKKAYIEGLTEDFRKTAKFKELNLDAAINESENGSLSPNGAEARANANSKLQSDMRTSAGLDNGTTKVKADVNGELNIDSNVDVRHHSVAEDIILNPAYAELTRKLLEDVTNEEGTDSK